MGMIKGLKENNNEIGVALSMLFRMSWKLLCCPICLMICVIESATRISIFNSTLEVQNELKPTPMSVNMISCEITRKAK
jgi:hypothetical protein